MRRLLIAVAILTAVSAARADALTVRDVVELSKAGVSDQILLALIDVDHRVYTLDAAAVKELKQSGVSDAVVLAMIHAGRTPDPGPAAAVDDAAVEQPSETGAPAPQPQVVVIDHHDTPEVREVPVPVAVAVPVAVPFDLGRRARVSTIIQTDSGAAVRARVPVPPNCTAAEPIYWGNGGKRRAGTWAPPPQIVCR